jgi:Ser/Thr protein kinase RdoA (MazF antagonist)
MDHPERRVRLVLVDGAGKVLGSLPAFSVATPWWQDVAPVVRGARELRGVEVTVLRLLETERATPHGGLVTYLAEVAQPVTAESWRGVLDEQPLRAPYARVGGPAADLAWAGRVLAGRGLDLAAAEQLRTWNLSSLWRLTAGGHACWLKVVPPFFAHEGALLARLAGSPVPVVLAHEGGRMLLAELPGEDLFEAPPALLPRMVSLMVDLQQGFLGKEAELLALGAADFRAEALTERIGQVVECTASELSRAQRAVLGRFVAHLPARMSALRSCGIPETLVHGDLHPGNFRGVGDTLNLLDWGDSGVGHPLLDQPAFLGGLSASVAAETREYWNQAWRARMPGCDPERATLLLAPVAAARQAVTYRQFLDRIEPAEHAYHRADPATWLERAADLVEKSD